MRSSLRSRPGIALAVALAAIVIIGGLLVGVFYASTQEFRIGRSTVMQTKALNAAEYGLNSVVATDFQNSWKPVTTVDSMLGTLAYQPGGGTVDTVRVTALGNGMFNITSEGFAGSLLTARARKRIAALATLRTIKLNLRGALTTRGATKIGGSSYINGYDTTVDNWGCPPSGPAMPGIAIGDTTQVSTSGCGGYTCVNGSPKVAQDSAAADTSTYTQFGDVNYADLAAMASKTYSSGTTLNGMQPSYNGTSCDTGDPNNWGDPLRTLGASAYCSSYYPIIYAAGDLSVTGGYGQGLLVVNGDLSVSGGFQFYGPVVVRGTLKTTGTGGHFNGGVMAENIDLSQNTVLGNAVVSFSSCAINMALQAAATVTFAKGRSWTDLY